MRMIRGRDARATLGRCSPRSGSNARIGLVGRPPVHMSIHLQACRNPRCTGPSNGTIIMFFLIRKIWFFLLLALAAGVPFAIHQAKNGELVERAQTWMASKVSKKSEEPVSDTDLSDTPAVAAPRSIPLANVFHYNWTPGQVILSWPKVSRVYDGDYVGLRVPLTTGVAASDLAGSLTFYFNADNRLQRITFVGVTGDSRPLVELVTTRFGLKAEPTTAAGLYVARWNGKPKSALRLAYPPMLTGQQQQRRLQVVLELNKPAAGYDLSARFKQTLEQDKLVGRWKPF